MELILKAAAAAVTSCIIGILLKRINPELSVVLSICAVAVILLAAMSFAEVLQDFVSIVKKLIGDTDILIEPILKCVAIAMITKISSDICKDSSQGAIASAVELAGALCAMAASAPLLVNVLKLIGDMV